MPIRGEANLNKLLRNLNPERNPGEYVFCTFDPAALPDRLDPLLSFRERERLTVILPQAQADELGLLYSVICAWITLNFHSALDAVGLTAAVSSALAQNGISCNLVAGYFHDHIFVPLQDAERALRILHDLLQQAVTTIRAFPNAIIGLTSRERFHNLSNDQ